MEPFKNLSQTAQFVLGGAVLYLIFSFFNWQALGPYGATEWHGFFGVTAGLCVFVLIAWELARMLKLNVSVGQFSPGLVSLVLAVILLVLTIGAFLDKNIYRAWPAYAGLIVAFLVAVSAFKRSKEEGVELKMPAGGTTSGGNDGASV